jgi:hypothetical protein
LPLSWIQPFEEASSCVDYLRKNYKSNSGCLCHDNNINIVHAKQCWISTLSSCHVLYKALHGSTSTTEMGYSTKYIERLLIIDESFKSTHISLSFVQQKSSWVGTRVNQMSECFNSTLRGPKFTLYFFFAKYFYFSNKKWK